MLATASTKQSVQPSQTGPLLAESGHRAQADRREGWQCRLPTHIGYWFGSRAYRSIR